MGSSVDGAVTTGTLEVIISFTFIAHNHSGVVNKITIRIPSVIVNQVIAQIILTSSFLCIQES